MMWNVFVVDALATSIDFKFYGSGGRGEKKKKGAGRCMAAAVVGELEVPLFVNEKFRGMTT